MQTIRKMQTINNYILIQPALIQPITLDEVKERLRLVGNSDFDVELTRLITVATEYCEKITGRDLINKTWLGFLDYFDCIAEFRKSKLQSINSIKYYQNNILQTVDSANYYFEKSNEYAKLVFTESFSPDERLQSIEIEFISGYGTLANQVPPSLKEAVISFVVWLYSTSGDCSQESDMANRLFKPWIISNNIFSVI